MQNYSFLQIYLHHFILKNKNLKKSLFYLENFIFKNKKEIKDNKHIFILGMPRSGTTALLNFFYESNEFASLTYNDMPFAMAPNFGSFFPKKKIKKIERKHGDGIEIDNYSPEALDEIFFLSFDEDELIGIEKISKDIIDSISILVEKKLDLFSSTVNNSK